MTDKITNLQARVKALEDAGNRLSFMAQTSGGTAGRDDGLMAAIDGWTAALAASIPADPVTNAGCRQQVKVKPLVWEPIGNMFHAFDPLFSVMAISENPNAYDDERAARIRSVLTVQPSSDVAAQFDNADWFWRTMDPDDSADTPSGALHRGMVGHFCVCEIASSYTGPTRYGFTAPVLDQDSDDEEFLHFATQQEAIDAAKDRIRALRATEEGEA